MPIIDGKKFIKLKADKIKIIDKSESQQIPTDLNVKQRASDIMRKIKTQQLDQPSNSSTIREKMALTASLKKEADHQKQIDQLREEHKRVNENLQKELQQMLNNKEELNIQINAQNDKVQKMELDREQLKLKIKTVGAENQKLLAAQSEQSQQTQNLKNSLEMADKNLQKTIQA